SASSPSAATRRADVPLPLARLDGVREGVPGRSARREVQLDRGGLVARRGAAASEGRLGRGADGRLLVVLVDVVLTAEHPVTDGRVDGAVLLRLSRDVLSVRDEGAEHVRVIAG